jgi:hypothetical protein
LDNNNKYDDKDNLLFDFKKRKNSNFEEFENRF